MFDTRVSADYSTCVNCSAFDVYFRCNAGIGWRIRIFTPRC